MRKEEKICFFCKKLKTEFNQEHFFPESIGGLFFNQICIDCNSRLNKNIDNPFLTNIIIGYYRTIYTLTKQSNRTIPNPLKGIILISGDDRYTLTVKPDGTIERRLITRINYPIDGDYSKGLKITIDSKDFNEEHLDHLKKKIAKNIGIEPKEITVGKTEIISTDKLSFETSFANNPLIFGFTKIIVEFALKYCPEFREDSYSKRYTDFLLDNNLDNELKEMINFNSYISAYIQDLIISKFYSDLQNKHAVFLMAIIGIGLVGIVKVFDITYTILLSPNIIKTQKSYYFFINNFKEKNKSVITLKRLEYANISIDSNYNLDGFSENDLFCENGFPIVYDALGTTICLNTFEIPSIFAPNFIVGNYIDNLEFIYSKPDFFFKNKTNNTLVPILEISYKGELESITV